MKPHYCSLCKTFVYPSKWDWHFGSKGHLDNEFNDKIQKSKNNLYYYFKQTSPISKNDNPDFIVQELDG